MNLSKEIHKTFINCLYTNEELEKENPPQNAIIVEGILHKIGFHPERIKSNRETIRKFLNEMPADFHKNGGGGMSFLNLCYDIHGNQWTDLHQRMNELVSLGLATNMVSYAISRDMWSMFPGAVPYLIFDTENTI